MFNFTTQTVYNNIATSGTDQNVWISENGKPEVRIGNTRFNKDNVLSIYKRTATPESLAKVTFDMSKVAYSDTSAPAEKTGRIVLYIRLSMNSQDSFYANAFVYKGKPLYVEFSIKKGETKEQIAKRVVNNAKKYFLFTLGSEQLIQVSANNGEVTFEGVNGYQQFTTAKLQLFDPSARVIDCCAEQGEYIDVITGVKAIYSLGSDGTPNVDETKKLGEDGTQESIADNEVPIYPGLEAFGDYNWIIHNLRLPTSANTGFYAVNKEEMPSVGKTYNQYIIKMCAKRLGVSGEGVGSEITSVTTHVLYVASDQDSKIQSALTTIAPVEGIVAVSEKPYGKATPTATPTSGSTDATE